MKMLMFQARRFAWTPFERTLEGAPDPPGGGEAADAAVVFLHAERRDEEAEARARVFRHVLKHVKWLANKRGFEDVVLHSFTHLGGETGDPAFARRFMVELAERLAATGYRVQITPFGWVCAWELSVHGEALAKVFKEL